MLVTSRGGRIRKLGACVSAIAIMLSSVAYLMSSAQRTTPREGRTAERESYAPSALTISAVELMIRYRADELAADEAYRGRLLTVTGAVSMIGMDLHGAPYVSLDTDGRILGVQGSFAAKDRSQLGRLERGDLVNMTGRCEGMYGFVALKGCSLHAAR